MHNKCVSRCCTENEFVDINKIKKYLNYLRQYQNQPGLMLTPNLHLTQENFYFPWRKRSARAPFALREPDPNRVCHVIIPKLSYIRLGGDRLEPINLHGNEACSLPKQEKR